MKKISIRKEPLTLRAQTIKLLTLWTVRGGDGADPNARPSQPVQACQGGTGPGCAATRVC